MKATLYGTRGSSPGTKPSRYLRYGGNTTCLRVESACLPSGWALASDMGTGFTQLSRDLQKSHKKVAVNMTHYHHDHTQGVFLAPHVFDEEAHLRIYGPSEQGVGPKEVFEKLFWAPLFPVQLPGIRDRLEFKPLGEIGTQVQVIHPEGGFNIIPVDKYKVALREGKQVVLDKCKAYLRECLAITMYKTAHPQYTVSYRFNEGPTGKSLVFLTDHENTYGYPRDLLGHVEGADLLIQDGQYSESAYHAYSAGYGHGTPDYCAGLAIAGKVKRLGITHHDSNASDEDVDKRVEEARAYARNHGGSHLEIFGCADYMELEV